MTVMADPLSQCADLDVRDKEVISSFAVSVNFFTLQIVISEEQTLVSTSHNKRLSQLQSSDSLPSLRSLLTSPFDEIFCLSLVISNN
jgi:hypothetical protein